MYILREEKREKRAHKYCNARLVNLFWQPVAVVGDLGKSKYAMVGSSYMKHFEPVTLDALIFDVPLEWVVRSVID